MPVGLAMMVAAAVLAAKVFEPPLSPPPRDVGDGFSADSILARLQEDSDRTRAVKQFDPRWVRTLTDRGEPITYTRADSADFEYIGMPIGGIAAGQLYLGGDGKLWGWDIFNTKSRRDVRGVAAHANPYRRSEKNLKAHHHLEQGFAVRVRVNGKTVTRTLDRDGFTDITFRGQYPIGYVTYTDARVPVRVELEAFSPFIPLNLADSTYPATVLLYTVTNTSDHDVSGELVGWLENAVCVESRRRVAGRLCNTVQRRSGVTLLNLSAADTTGPQAPATARPDLVFEDFEADLANWEVQGDAFATNPRPNFHHQPLKGYKGKGLADSFRNSGQAGASAAASDRPTGRLRCKPFTIRRKTIQFLIGGGSHPDTTCVNLVVGGKVVRTATGDNSETLRPHAFHVADLQGRKAHLEIVDAHTGGWGHVLVDHIVFSDTPGRVADATPLEGQVDYGSMCLAVLDDGAAVEASASFRPPDGPLTDGSSAGVASFADASPVGALGRAFRLKPGQKAVARFVLAWYFPNTPQFPIRTPTGRSYGERFNSAAAVAEHVAGNLDSLARNTRLWHDTWYDSTLPWWFLDRTFLNTSILATNTCYLFKDGRFYGYEGVYHGHGTCTHVWGYVQAPGRLFPELERRLRENVDYKPGIAFDPGTGMIGYRSETRMTDAVDGQAGVILRTYLVHQMQPDDAFLRRVYPSMKKAMDYLTDTYDADRDGVLTGGQHNTLDAKWYGKIPWLSLHYTAALRAAAAMADEMRDAAYAERCRALADRGRAYIENHLFNGEYFFHEPDPAHPKSPGVFNGIEYSQLLGQSWAYQVGLGPILDPQKVTAHLDSLWKYNFTTDVGPFRDQYKNGRWFAMPGEGGIIACTWPHGGDEALTHGSRHFAGYLNECQPGYEWAASSLMMWHGMPYRALAHVRTMHRRYHGAKRNPWNEVEWGSHYSRSMASYGVFTAACGFEHHGPGGHIGFAPRFSRQQFKAAYTAAEGWGTFEQVIQGGGLTAALRQAYGRLRVRTIALEFDGQVGQVHVAGEPAEFQQRAGRVLIRLPAEVTLTSGDSLAIRVEP